MRFPGADVITRDITGEWATIRPTEGENYRNRRVSALRQLSLYMLPLGFDADLPRNIGKAGKPVLYIPTHEEISAFFRELDSWVCRNLRGQRTTGEYKMLFRRYYCCGLRLSEARLLKKENKDFLKGILTILESKGHKDRLVYLPPDGIKMLTDYLRHIEKKLPCSPWLFPGKNPDAPLTPAAIQHRFKDCWNRLPFAAVLQ